MRSAIAKHIRRRVEQLLRQRLPMFQEEKEVELPPGSRLYAWKASDRLWWYLFLMFRDDGDWFRLRLSWSKGKFQTRFGGLPCLNRSVTFCARSGAASGDLTTDSPRSIPMLLLSATGFTITG